MKIDRIISIVTLVAALGALFLALRRPAPVGPVAQAPAQVEQNAQAFQSKIEQLEQPKAAGSAPSRSSIDADGGKRRDCRRGEWGRESCGVRRGFRFSRLAGPGDSWFTR